MPRIRIIYRSSAFNGRELACDDDIVRIGRDPLNQVPFDEHADRSVSRRHAEIRWEGAAPVLHPAQGRIVLRWGRTLTGPTPLAPGDVVELCGVGGPSFEVQFESQRRPKVLGGGDVDHAGATMMNMPAFIAGEGFVGAKADESELPTPPDGSPMLRPDEPYAPIVPIAPVPAPRAPPAAPAMRFAPAPAPAPAPQPGMLKGTMQLEQQSSTQMMRALKDDPGAVAHTQLIASPVVLPNAKPEPRKLWVLFAGIGGGLLFVIIVAAIVSTHLSRVERRRLAVERVDRLRAALAANAGTPHVSPEDWEIYTEVMAERPKPAPDQPKTPAAPPQTKEEIDALRREAEAKAAEAERLKAEEVARKAAEEAERKRLSEATAGLRTQARELFASLRRNEIARVKLGRAKDPATQMKRRELAAERAQKQAEYEGILTQLASGGAPGAQEQLVRTLARYLGECDAALPAKFLADANQAIGRLRTDGAQRTYLQNTLIRAAQNQFGPGITAALGDQGVPVELFFIPFRESAFDATKVGDDGATKGMWQLGEAVAKRLGLAVGEPDERQAYAKESKAAAKLMRELYLGPAAGSAMLLMATYEHGDAGVLGAVKQKAGLAADESDPGKATFWRVYEAGALDEARKKAFLQLFAQMVAASAPKDYGFDFAIPLEHVAATE